jgi:hypothetical protein
MAKVGRAARVASRQRVETLGNATSAATDKTIVAGETGELYLIDHNHGSDLNITLPPMQDGAYFKFIWKTEAADDDADVVFTSTEATNGDFAGTIIEQVANGTDGATATETAAGSAKTLRIGSSSNTSIGSWVECVCDGTKWYWTGCQIAAAVGTVAFS